MKILTIVYNLDRGGTQRAAQNFSVAYKNKGHDVKVLPVYSEGVRKELLEKEDIFVFKSIIDNEDEYKEIEKWCPDIVHIHRAGDPEDDLTKILKKIKTTTNCKIIETNVFSCFDPTEGGELIDLHTHLSNWCKWKWQCAMDDDGQEPLSTILPYMVIEDNFYKIEDKNKIDAFKEKYEIPLDKFIFGRVGQKSTAKWSLVDTQAFINYLKINPDIHMVLVGTTDQVINLINKSNVSTSVTILDYLDGDEELNLAYNSFDVFIHGATIGESFGMVFAESMLTETPVISISTPKRDNTQHEVVAPECGFIATNSASMVSCMDKLYKDRELVLKMGKKSRNHIIESYTPMVLTDKAINMMEVLLNNDSTHWNKKLQEAGYETVLTRDKINEIYSHRLGEASVSEKLYMFKPRLYRKCVDFAYRLNFTYYKKTILDYLVHRPKNSRE